MTTLDQFLPPTTVKTKKDTGIDIEEKCSNPHCGKKLSPKDPIYTLRVRGKEGKYCPACAKAILRPQENTEENL